MDRRPPHSEVVGRLRAVTGHAPWGRRAERTATIAHYAFGGVAGAVYGVVAPRRAVRPAASPMPGAIWAVSYLGVFPRIGLMPRPSPRRHRAARSSLAVDHVVYGLRARRVCSRIADRDPGRHAALLALALADGGSGCSACGASRCDRRRASGAAPGSDSAANACVELGLEPGDAVRVRSGTRPLRRLPVRPDPARRVSRGRPPGSRRVLGQVEVTAQEVLVGRLVHREGDDVDRLEARGHALLARAVRVAQLSSFRAELSPQFVQCNSCPPEHLQIGYPRCDPGSTARRARVHPVLRTLPR